MNIKRAGAAVLLLSIGQFALFTYLRPFLETVTKADVSAVADAVGDRAFLAFKAGRTAAAPEPHLLDQGASTVITRWSTVVDCTS